MFIVFPNATPFGIGGVGLGNLTPAFVLIFNTIGWSLPAYAWFRLAGQAHQPPPACMQATDCTVLAVLHAGPGLHWCAQAPSCGSVHAGLHAGHMQAALCNCCMHTAVLGSSFADKHCVRIAGFEDMESVKGHRMSADVENTALLD